MKRISILALFTVLVCGLAQAQSGFTYQGRLNDGGAPANGQYDLTFRLFSVASGGTQIGADIVVQDVQVTNGTFTVQLDFGAVPFTSATGNFLEISVRPGASTGTFTMLTPRLAVSTSPYSVKSLTADNAANSTNASNLGGVAANQYVTVTTANTSFIQNTTTTQASSNFNISGNGTVGGNLSANVVNATTQYDLNGIRILRVPVNTSNLFVGYAAGNDNSTGNENSFFGYFAGERTNIGVSNSFVGRFAGRFNTGGSRNSFFGGDTGMNNTAGSENTFIGGGVGLGNTLGSNNTLIGAGANVASNNLSFASAFGAGAVVSSSNTLVFGRKLDTVQIPGALTVTGALTGNGAGLTNLNAGNFTTGVLPIDRGGTGLSSTGAAGNFLRSNGSGWTTSRILSEDIPLNLADYIWNSAALQNASFNVGGWGLIGGRLGVGTQTPGSQAEIFSVGLNGLRVQKTTAGGFVASFGENGVFNIDRTGSVGGRFTVLENGNVGIGTNTPSTKLEVNGTGIVRARINSDTNAGVQFALGNQSKWSLSAQDNGAFQIWNYTTGQHVFWITPNDSLFGIGTITPTAKLEVNTTGGIAGLRVQTDSLFGKVASFGGNGYFEIDSTIATGGRLKVNPDGVVEIGGNPFPLNGSSVKLVVNGFIKAVVPPGIGTPMCWEATSQTIMQCGISSIQYKTNVENFTPGLDLIRRLRPVSFNWKQDGSKDLGLIAEEVNEVEPLLNYFDVNGKAQGVKYDRVSVVAVNAIKEQQTQIEEQQKQINEQNDLIKAQNEKLERQQTEIERQKKELEALKKLVCSQNGAAEICRTEN